ncbi:Hypothetical protein NTJ_03379 [Nesidiocoris tenuis]|uniref:Uncharacterized protein n=1 Tax=Nesidiocoris tenuis TaxID=355587 RepID=A0ABN7AI61_9HEMI|nr:Hypothetical protein NTJ_03379 [Nesidiocoris tenuis]
MRLTTPKQNRQRTDTAASDDRLQPDGLSMVAGAGGSACATFTQPVQTLPPPPDLSWSHSLIPSPISPLLSIHLIYSTGRTYYRNSYF